MPLVGVRVVLVVVWALAVAAGRPAGGAGPGDGGVRRRLHDRWPAAWGDAARGRPRDTAGAVVRRPARRRHRTRGPGAARGAAARRRDADGLRRGPASDGGAGRPHRRHAADLGRRVAVGRWAPVVGSGPPGGAPGASCVSMRRSVRLRPTATRGVADQARRQAIRGDGVARVGEERTARRGGPGAVRPRRSLPRPRAPWSAGSSGGRSAGMASGRRRSSPPCSSATAPVWTRRPPAGCRRAGPTTSSPSRWQHRDPRRVPAAAGPVGRPAPPPLVRRGHPAAGRLCLPGRPRGIGGAGDRRGRHRAGRRSARPSDAAGQRAGGGGDRHRAGLAAGGVRPRVPADLRSHARDRARRVAGRRHPEPSSGTLGRPAAAVGRAASDAAGGHAVRRGGH